MNNFPTGLTLPATRHSPLIVRHGAFSLGDLPERIRNRITVDEHHGCWRGSKTEDPFQYAAIDGQQLHRVVYELLVGEIPPKHVLDHVKRRGCHWNSCCLPSHLDPVTSRVNVLRGTSFAAVNFAKTECATCGCAFDLINTYFRPNGHRDCRCCIRARVAKYRGRVPTSHPELRLAA